MTIRSCLTGGNACAEVSLVEWKRELAIELRNQRIPGAGPVAAWDRQKGPGRYDEDWFSPGGVPGPHASVDALCPRTGRARNAPAGVAGRQEKVGDRNACMYASGKSDIGNSTKEIVEQNQPIGGGDDGGKCR